MTIKFNHAIIAARDRQGSASFYAELFGRPAPTSWGPFTSVSLGDDVHLQFAEPGVAEIQMQHYAFLVDDGCFDEIYARLLSGEIEHWADPQGTLSGQINTNHGGRGVYFRDPAGHGLEVITRPYGWTGQ
ncbi:VOC family protein [Deinococcus sp.]|uniref:VOC family protein n=1 Tax=Deinococcus sp. TaxID=47478 RepID=UPI0025ED986B|nr:VOC family protein [Deinococcus sp.]